MVLFNPILTTATLFIPAAVRNQEISQTLIYRGILCLVADRAPHWKLGWFGTNGAIIPSQLHGAINFSSVMMHYTKNMAVSCLEYKQLPNQVCVDGDHTSSRRQMEL